MSKFYISYEMNVKNEDTGAMERLPMTAVAEGEDEKARMLRNIKRRKGFVQDSLQVETLEVVGAKAIQALEDAGHPEAAQYVQLYVDSYQPAEAVQDDLEVNELDEVRWLNETVEQFPAEDEVDNLFRDEDTSHYAAITAANKEAVAELTKLGYAESEVYQMPVKAEDKPEYKHDEDGTLQDMRLWMPARRAAELVGVDAPQIYMRIRRGRMHVCVVDGIKHVLKTEANEWYCERINRGVGVFAKGKELAGE